MGSYIRDFYAPKATQQPTVGDTKFSVINDDHMGWMNCDGRLVSTEDYPLLFRVIGYSFGGSGDQFRLPDMRSRVPGAIDQGSEAGLSNRVLGEAVGKETHTLIIAEMPSHNHGTDASNNVVGNGLTGVSGEHIHTGIADASGVHTHTGTTDPTGSAPESETTAAGVYTGPVVAGSGTHTHTFTTNPSGLHQHTLTIDPSGNHQHTIKTQGGDQPHNNMQPTLFIGNMFIYSGKLHSGASKWRYANNTNIL
jgi:microcystin-dependent protein